MVYSIIGGTGEGKTCYATRFLILSTLAFTDRVVCCNICLFPDELKLEIERMGGEYNPDQLIMFPSEKHIANSQLPENLQKELETPYEMLPVEGFDFTKFWESTPKDALVIFDEAGVYFGALSFDSRKMASVLGDYVKLHRHLGHDVYFMSQSWTSIVNSLRKEIQKITTIYSFYQHPIAGIFKMPLFFIRHFDVGLTPQPKSCGFEFRRYNARFFKLYDSYQHRDFHKTLDREGKVSKEKFAKKGLVGRLQNLFANRPHYFIGGLLALFALAYTGYHILFGAFGDMIGINNNTEENASESEKIAMVETGLVPSSDDNTSGLFSGTADRSRTKRNRERGAAPSQDTKTNKYGGLKVRGY